MKAQTLEFATSLQHHRRRSTAMSAESLPRTEASVLRGHEGAVLAARFNSNGEYCLSCGKDRTIRLWNPHRGLHIKTYKSHGREVRDVHVTAYENPIRANFDHLLFFCVSVWLFFPFLIVFC